MSNHNVQIQAVFIDRDGTIGEVGHDLNPSSFVTYPDFDQSLSLLQARDLKIFSFTNQPDIARGLVDMHLMIQQYQHWGFTQAYICPHPDAMNCECRKPLPGMLLNAAEEYGLDLKQCVVIGDSWRDMLAADQVGCIKILVKTGEGKNVQEQINHLQIDYQATGFSDGVKWIIEKTAM